MHFQLRELKLEDKDQFLAVLSHLSQCETISVDNFREVMMEREGTVFTTVALMKNRIVGTGSLIIEYKFSHGGRPVGHIEDLVVLPEIRNQLIGSFILTRLVELATIANCRKIILDCKKSNVPFYNKAGFGEIEEANLRMDIAR
jgi:glucosamine-phosphate N-acetyltransferase